MKILQVSSGYFPSIGGLEEQVRNISERLAREHEVVVFTCDPSGEMPREEEIGGVRVFRFRSFSPSNAYHLSLPMARALRRANFDIIHGHNYHAFPLYLSRYATSGKFIVTPHYHGHGHTPLRNLLFKLYRPLGKGIFRDADRLIAVSEYEKKLLVRDFALNENKIVVIPNGINLEESIGESEVSRDMKSILYIGRLEEYKGIQHIIAVLPELSTDFHLQIVGKGPYKGKLMKLINRLELNSRVRFYQDLPREELLRMYACAGLFVLLSQYEAFSIVVAEALALKTPCIVANTSALTEWVDNINCFGIDYPISREKLAGLINKVAGKKASGVKLWDWDDVVRGMQGVYDLGGG